jgi:hypothetical protein
MTFYRIDKNVAIPANARLGREASIKTRTIEVLKVGESFFLPKRSYQRKMSETSKELSSAGSHISKKYPGRKFTVRSKVENRQKGARIWRVA